MSRATVSPVGRGGARCPQPRSRPLRLASLRKCLETLADILERRTCSSLVLESRGSRADRRDRDMLDALRSRRIVTALRITHQAARSDPLLWAADAVCGAVTADLQGRSSHLDVITGSVEVVRPRS